MPDPVDDPVPDPVDPVRDPVDDAVPDLVDDPVPDSVDDAVDDAAGNDVGGVPRSDDDGPGYAEALAELEAILAELDGADLDVDVLGARVRRAAELIRRCRARITDARLEVEKVVAEFDE